MTTAPETIPISLLNALVFCERRFYYEFVLGEMVVNEAVLEGSLQHERVHTPGNSHTGEIVQQRRLALHSQHYGLTGFADLVEQSGGVWCVVEYKRGRRGDWESDQVQLCAQALCLEEALDIPIAAGEIFYFASRRRQEVAFTPALRATTIAAIARARQVAALPALPPPLANWNKCRHCSLEPLCLPRETLHLRQQQGALPHVHPLPD